MTEKKAREVFEAYKKAELTGTNEQASALEQQLKDAGWKITVGPSGLTIIKIKKGDGADGDLNEYLPRETNNRGFQGGTDNQGATTKSILIFAGIGLGVIGLIILIAYFAKKNKQNVGLQQG
jgi:hypothetical protein